MIHRIEISFLLAMAFAIVPLGCNQQKNLPEPQPRPIRTMKLIQSEPATQVYYTGSVTSWKEEEIGFEVGGRVETILETGTIVDGPTVTKDNEIEHRTGSIIASLNAERYQAELDAAIARQKSTQAKRNAQQKQLELVFPTEIKARKADLLLANSEYDRTYTLAQTQAASKAELDKAKAEVDVAQAKLDQLIQSEEVKKADIEALDAQLLEANEDVKQAQRNLEDTKLRAPFRGQISSVNTYTGGVVGAGEPVLKLQMMDPMQVEVQVSAQTDAGLHYNEIVQVYAKRNAEPMPAFVYEKATVADSSTRTFVANLLIRNWKETIGMPSEYDRDKDVRSRRLTRALQLSSYDENPYYLMTACMYQDDKGTYVWKLKERNPDVVHRISPQPLEVVKTYVVPGEKKSAFVNVAIMQQIVDTGELDPELDFVVGPLTDMAGNDLEPAEATKRIEEQGYFYFVRENWKFRPGDVVEVKLNDAPEAKGFYVPTDAVSNPIDQPGESFIFVVKDNSVKKVKVNASEVVSDREIMRIEAAGEDTLTEGTEIAIEGAHFLVDGEKIKAISN